MIFLQVLGKAISFFFKGVTPLNQGEPAFIDPPEEQRDKLLVRLNYLNQQIERHKKILEDVERAKNGPGAQSSPGPSTTKESI